MTNPSAPVPEPVTASGCGCFADTPPSRRAASNINPTTTTELMADAWPAVDGDEEQLAKPTPHTVRRTCLPSEIEACTALTEGGRR
ncbi:hypothetical protein [Rhizohabitans arisaemae]|uniref:hypothetical protein n=1 Tax=Rhizohabitans arisaemae TaxID=2720610 RepID=UPI0024B17857|nr:hypothetical protein [Rhizohabitans arisaemae]